MRVSPPRALIFDWDNTLVDTWQIIHHALSATFEAMGRRPWSPVETRQRVRRSVRETFPELFGNRGEEAMRIFYETFKADHLARLRAIDGATEMLSGLAKAGYPMAVLSNKQGAILRREADHLGWSGYFHRVVGAEDAARDKPAVEAVALALEGSGIAPGPSVWLVGDTDVDMLCASRSGCIPVLMRKEPPEIGEFGDFLPKIHVSSCHALAELALAP